MLTRKYFKGACFEISLRLQEKKTGHFFISVRAQHNLSWLKPNRSCLRVKQQTSAQKKKQESAFNY